jgi:hypothetical protein
VNGQLSSLPTHILDDLSPVLVTGLYIEELIDFCNVWRGYVACAVVSVNTNAVQRTRNLQFSVHTLRYDSTQTEL